MTSGECFCETLDRKSIFDGVTPGVNAQRPEKPLTAAARADVSWGSAKMMHRDHELHSPVDTPAADERSGGGAPVERYATCRLHIAARKSESRRERMVTDREPQARQLSQCFPRPAGRD